MPPCRQIAIRLQPGVFYGSVSVVPVIFLDIASRESVQVGLGMTRRAIRTAMQGCLRTAYCVLRTGNILVCGCGAGSDRVAGASYLSVKKGTRFSLI